MSFFRQYFFSVLFDMPSFDAATFNGLVNCIEISSNPTIGRGPGFFFFLFVVDSGVSSFILGKFASCVGI